MNLPEIHEFLGCRTPDGWISAALADQETLLIDHKNCEFKAASTALSLIAKYHSHVDLINMMSRLAREELVHHEQVMRLMVPFLAAGMRAESGVVDPAMAAAQMRPRNKTSQASPKL